MPNQASNHEGRKGLLSASAMRKSFFQRDLLDSLPAAAYTCDAQGLITYFNVHAVDIWGRAPRLNHPSDRFCGSMNLFTADGAPLDPEQSWMAKSLRDGIEYSGHEITLERPSGERVWVLVYANPIHGDSGELLGALNIMIDISDHKRVENALKDADRSKNAFLATLAHELRNPLAPLRNATEILHLKVPPVPELQWALDVIDRQMRQITRLVDDLLDVGRITSNKFTLRKGRVALGDILNAAVEISQPYIQAAHLQLHIDIPDEPAYINGDVTRLTQVFVNLLHNSTKYTEAGGKIWLSMERKDHEVEVAVRDTGIGISPQLLPRIFDMFAQAEQPPDWSPGGLGIGLTLAKQVVDIHGGSISAFSEGSGLGSRFSVRLPVVDAVHCPLERRPVQQTSSALPSDLRILVVDDDKDITDSLVMLLELMGNKIRTARDGCEAMEVAEGYRPDVMLLDIGMPKLNGYEAARQIRQQPWGDDMVLVAFTGWGQDADRQRAREAGFDHHLVKPVDPQALVGLLASVGAEQASRQSHSHR